MTSKSYGSTEMIIRGLPGWLAWFAGGWGDPLPQGKYWRPASAVAGFDIRLSRVYLVQRTQREAAGLPPLSPYLRAARIGRGPVRWWPRQVRPRLYYVDPDEWRLGTVWLRGGCRIFERGGGSNLGLHVKKGKVQLRVQCSLDKLVMINTELSPVFLACILAER